MDLQSDEFNVIQFEKRLTALKDSQDHINTCCKWCLENRKNHKKIVTSWLNVLKRVKVEQRLNLFYLANDVIQYSKRKQYEFVESWGTALQKATTLVRDDKVKHKIVRIFNIWQQRGVYSEEFISDLCGLISVVPTPAKSDDPHEFQSTYVTNKIKQCSKLENETDLKLKVLKEHNPKIQIESETFCASLKERAHVDDVEKELETYVKHLEGYINALKAEIKCRISNISVLKQANNHLDKDKRDVRVVANAYKVFGNKIKAFQRKFDEHKNSLSSPIPSPDIDAPSPSPDCDIELPDDNEDKDTSGQVSNFSVGYYNPVPPPVTEASGFVTNGYTSFIGSSFNVDTISHAPSLHTEKSPDASSFLFQDDSHLPLLPPPMPPFNPKTDYGNSYQEYEDGNRTDFNTSSYNNPTMTTFTSNMTADTNNSFESTLPPNGTATTNYELEEYNPEQEPEFWDTDESWNDLQLDSTDTPESPPMYEKEGYVEGIEYHENIAVSVVADIDHRLMNTIAAVPAISRLRGKDVDHRNLISLTGSPADSNTNTSQPEIWSTGSRDKDYRNEIPSVDQDYRLPPYIAQLQLPPPPPPPPKSNSQGILTNQFVQPLHHHQHKQTQSASPRKIVDNIENIDMDLSEDEEQRFTMDVFEDSRFPPPSSSSLKPPPPLPDLPDDVDANTFLDDLDSDLNSSEFTANLHDLGPGSTVPPPTAYGPPYGNFPPPPPPAPPQQWSSQHFKINNFPRRGNRGTPSQFNNNRGFQRGRGRGTYGFRGANNFRGRGFSRGSGRSVRSRGGLRGNFQGAF